jgi:hypothetical protein
MVSMCGLYMLCPRHVHVVPLGVITMVIITMGLIVGTKITRGAVLGHQPSPGWVRKYMVAAEQRWAGCNGQS